MVWFLIPLVAGVVALASNCGDDDVDEGQIEKDTSDDNDTWVGDIVDAASQMKDAADAKAQEILDAPAPDGGPMEVETNEVEVAAGDDGESSADLPKPVTPAAPEASFFSSMPCGFAASLRYDKANNSFLATCGGVTNSLFRSPTLGSNSGEWTKVGDVPGYPSNHINLGGDYHLVSHSMPDGFTIINAKNGTVSQSVDFSAIDIMDEVGEKLTFIPNNPSGTALLGGRLFIVPSNLNEFGMDPTDTTFHAGIFIHSPYNGDGTVDMSGAIAHYTGGANTTGVAAIAGQTNKIAVLSSNDYNPSTDGDAILSICKLPEMDCTDVILKGSAGESLTAQISPDLAMSEGGTILVGIQKPYNGVIGVNSETGDIVFNKELPGVKNFISAMGASGSVAAAVDFGIFGESGRVIFFDTNPNGWEGVLETELSGVAGPATMADDKLYVATTGGAEGEMLYSVDMKGLE